MAARAVMMFDRLCVVSDEWTEGRRYMSLEAQAKGRIRIISTDASAHPGAGGGSRSQVCPTR